MQESFEIREDCRLRLNPGKHNPIATLLAKADIDSPGIEAHVYESPSFVKKERTMGASVNLPFVYPSIGASLAPVGCFEVALAAPSVNEPKAQ
jgi:hypothetical protein